MGNSTTEDFCKWAEIPDRAYCYPDVNNIKNAPPTLTGDGGENVEDDVELCVEPNSRFEIIICFGVSYI